MYVFSYDFHMGYVFYMHSPYITMSAVKNCFRITLKSPDSTLLTHARDIVSQTKSHVFNLPQLNEVYLTVSGFNSLHAR